MNRPIDIALEHIIINDESPLKIRDNTDTSGIICKKRWIALWNQGYDLYHTICNNKQIQSSELKNIVITMSVSLLKKCSHSYLSLLKEYGKPNDWFFTKLQSLTNNSLYLNLSLVEDCTYYICSSIFNHDIELLKEDQELVLEILQQL